MPDNILYVGEGKKETADFSEFDAIATRGLEACTAVVTYSPKKGSIGHLTNISNLTDFFSWLRKNIEPGTNSYITGGMDGKSELLVGKLEQGFLYTRLNLLDKDVLGQYRRHIRLDKRGRLYITYFTQFMNAEREIEDVIMDSKEVSLA